jgi:hypothetical protein
MVRKLTVVVVALSGLMLTGCNPSEMMDSAVASKAREYFPAAEVSHPSRDRLIIDTHVRNVSEAFGAKVMGELLKENRQSLQAGMALLGYTLFAVSFDDKGCAWSPNDPTKFECGSRNAPEVRTYLIDDQAASLLQPIRPTVAPFQMRPLRR